MIDYIVAKETVQYSFVRQIAALIGLVFFFFFFHFYMVISIIYTHLLCNLIFWGPAIIICDSALAQISVCNLWLCKSGIAV